MSDCMDSAYRIQLWMTWCIGNEETQAEESNMQRQTKRGRMTSVEVFKKNTPYTHTCKSDQGNENQI